MIKIIKYAFNSHTFKNDPISLPLAAESLSQVHYDPQEKRLFIWSAEGRLKYFQVHFKTADGAVWRNISWKDEINDKNLKKVSQFQLLMINDGYRRKFYSITGYDYELLTLERFLTISLENKLFNFSKFYLTR